MTSEESETERFAKGRRKGELIREELSKSGLFHHTQHVGCKVEDHLICYTVMQVNCHD